MPGLDEAPDPARDWDEDQKHENGFYFCTCKSCGKSFMGHKRRTICRVCAFKP